MKKSCIRCNFATDDSIEQMSKNDIKIVEGCWCYNKQIFIADTRAKEVACGCDSFIHKRDV